MEIFASRYLALLGGSPRLVARTVRKQHTCLPVSRDLDLVASTIPVVLLAYRHLASLGDLVFPSLASLDDSSQLLLEKFVSSARLSPMLTPQGNRV